MRPLLPLACLAALAACARQDLQVYTVPKEEAPAPVAGAAAPAPEAASGTRVTWRVPAGWDQKPASGMRVATFLVPSGGGAPAEVSVTSFPGDAGGDLANVNRWRGQLGLPELSAAELSRESRRLSSPAGELLVVDFAGAPEKGRMLGARLRHGGRSWFFKMTGAAPSVASAKPAFEGFLASLSDGR